jgi:hypothetical protein
VHHGFILTDTGGILTGRRVEDGTHAWSTPSEGLWKVSGDFIVTSIEHPPRLQLFDPRAQQVVMEFARGLRWLLGVTDRIAIVWEDYAVTNRFAGIDLRDGRELWRRETAPVQTPADAWFWREVQDGVVVFERNFDREARSARTGEVVWRVSGPFQWRRGRYWWNGNLEARRFDILDAATGDVSAVPASRGSGAGARIDMTYDDYMVSLATKGIYFFHRTRPHQRLPIPNAAALSSGVQLGDDIVLRSNDGKLRAIRRVR